jgi:hypothetical protein
LSSFSRSLRFIKFDRKAVALRAKRTESRSVEARLEAFPSVMPQVYAPCDIDASKRFKMINGCCVRMNNTLLIFDNTCLNVGRGIA